MAKINIDFKINFIIFFLSAFSTNGQAFYSSRSDDGKAAEPLAARGKSPSYAPGFFSSCLTPPLICNFITSIVSKPSLSITFTAIV